MDVELPDVCSENCKIFPCFVVSRGKECKIKELPSNVRDTVLTFYVDGVDGIKKQIINMLAMLYIKSLRDNDTEAQLRVLREMAYVYRVMKSDVGIGEKDYWEKILEMMVNEYSETKGD